MRAVKFSFVIMFLLAVIASCEKGDQGNIGLTGPAGTNNSGAANTELYAKWQKSSGGDENDADLQYLYINSDNSVEELWQDTSGLRSIQHYTAYITSTQFQGKIGLYNYSFNRGGYMTFTNNNETIVFTKNPNAPVDTVFIMPVYSLDIINAPAQLASDLAWDGTDLYYYCGYSSSASKYSIAKVNPSTHNTDGFLYVSHDVTGLTWNTSNLWTSGNYNFYEEDTAGNDLFTSKATLHSYNGIASQGQYIWFNGSASVNQYNTLTDVVVSTIPVTASFYAIEIKGGYFYLCAGNNYICKCTMNPFKVISTYQFVPAYNTSTGYTIYGMVTDGTYFWLSVFNNNTGAYEIDKVNLP